MISWLSIILAIFIAVDGEWVELTQLRSTEKVSSRNLTVYYNPNYKVLNETILITMGIRLGGIGLVMLQINLIFFLVIKLFVLRDWGELNSEDKELIQAMAFHKSDKEKIETKKTKIKDAERNRRMKPVPAPQSFQANQSVTAPPNDLQESEKLHEARTQCDSIGSKEKFSGAHASRSTDQNGLPLRVSNSENQQSTRLPRAKKGHQVDVLKLQEDLILADSQEDPEEKDKEKNIQQKTKSN